MKRMVIVAALLAVVTVVFVLLVSTCGYSEMEMQAQRDRIEQLQRALEVVAQQADRCVPPAPSSGAAVAGAAGASSP